MFKNAFWVSFLTTGGLCVWILTRVGPALRSYHRYILHAYGQQIGVYVLLFLLTLTLAIMLIARVIWLQDTGRKLQHAAKELQLGGMAKTPESLLQLIQTRK